MKSTAVIMAANSTSSWDSSSDDGVFLVLNLLYLTGV